MTIRAVRSLVAGLCALGHAPGPILAAPGIPEASLDDPDARIPMSAAVTLLAGRRTDGGSESRAPLAEHTSLGSVDVLFYAMLSSPTLGAAYERLCRYQRLIHDTSHVGLTVQEDRTVLRHWLPGGRPAPRQTTSTRGDRPRPPIAVLALPCERADPALLAVLDGYAAERLEQAPRSERLADRVRTALAEALRDGEPGAGPLAARLKMSARTLHRHLAAEGTSYRSVLEQLRRELALRYPAEERLAIAEIAFLVGFSEPSAFYRAVRR